MNRKATRQTMEIVVATLLLTVGNLQGQTAIQTTTSGQQSAWQVLNSIIVNANDGTTPLKIYPPGFLDYLQSLGTSPYPPVPTTSSASSRTMVKTQGTMSPMDSQQSDPPTYAVIDLGTLGG